jgi:hypothetical protein
MVSSPTSESDFEFMRILLQNAALHFKLVFGLTATRPQLSYLGSEKTAMWELGKLIEREVSTGRR